MTRTILSSLILLVMLVAAINVYSQNAHVQGWIKDSVRGSGVADASIFLLNRDSTFIQATQSSKDGYFVFRKAVGYGAFHLVVTHSGYISCDKLIVIEATGTVDAGTIYVRQKSDTLAAAIVIGVVPTRISGDTIVYNTSHLKFKQNAVVEELLRRLPGFQVDGNGNITVNGSKIQRLLVDGEDVFSSDPSIISRNFNADMISKVQVLDKKSDQAQFTGIDDGQTTKTLNLLLKEESKRGFFGKVESGGDFDNKFKADGLLGSFKGRRQFVALGIASNDGSTGFSDGNGAQRSSLFLSSVPDLLGGSAGTGIPTIIAGGIHFADKWNGDEDHTDAHYQYGHLVTFPISSSIIQQALVDTVYRQVQGNKSANNMDQQNMGFDFDYRPDSLSAFRISLAASTSSGDNDFSSSGAGYFNDTLVNSSSRKVQSKVETRNLRGSILWRLRSKNNSRRSFSVVTGLVLQDNVDNGFILSQNGFFRHGGFLFGDTLDQRKEFNTSAKIFNSSINYTEAVWKKTTLGLSYGFSSSMSNNLQGTYGKSGNKYVLYIDSLSSQYEDIVVIQRGTASLQYKEKDLGYSVGADILQYSYRQREVNIDTLLKEHYIGIVPRVNVYYNFSQYKGIAVNYDESIQLPSVFQLQPVQNNNDPMHIILGNPNLRPSINRHTVIAYHSFRPLVFNFALDGSFATDGTSSRTITDSVGRQICQPINVSGARNLSFVISLDEKVKPLNANFGIRSGLSYGTADNFVNSELSHNSYINFAGGVTITKYASDRYNFQVVSDASYYYMRSSINADAATFYWTQNNFATVSAYPFKSFEVNSSFNFFWRQKTSITPDHNSNILWNASAIRNFFNNQLTVRLQVNDILAQNIGITRSVSGNQVSETTQNVIGRYWMLFFTWRFKAQGRAK